MGRRGEQKHGLYQDGLYDEKMNRKVDMVQSISKNHLSQVARDQSWLVDDDGEWMASVRVSAVEFADTSPHHYHCWQRST